MTLFVIMAAALVLLALLFVLPPLLGSGAPSASETPRQAQASLRVLREQWAQLRADHAGGRIAAADYTLARAELERRALREGRATDAPADTRPARRWAAAIALLLPLITAALYGALGTPAGITAGRAGGDRMVTANADHDAPGQMTDLLAGLIQRLEANPADPAGWTMLANTYLTLEDFAGGAATWRRIGAKAPDDPTVLADWADILATAANGDFTGEPDRLIGRVLARAPDDVKGLALAGTSAFFRHDYPAAIGYWERLLTRVDPDDPVHAQVQASLDEARQQLGPSLDTATPSNGVRAAAPAVR
ncbi:c-type cytochrome biogenesis protein CcmI [Achromobacter insuavis]|uniref:c-type cytochrome biogenesis protein CcmI n=1 Tax=Achromobacter insuavis TaxID=1287735 RepID=UPI001F141C86|nr:c-type cytochrome biogenesis protein CcmI [Achromobacter insuavis]